MRRPVTLTIDGELYSRLHQHLFPGDRDEHGAVLAAGISESSRGTRLLVRDLIVARDGVDFVPGTRGYRALTSRFVAESSGFCADHGLCYLAVHNHGGSDQVEFSADDLASHERGYPALLDITRGGPVGALVFAKNAVAGDIWTPEGRFDLTRARILAPQIKDLVPTRRTSVESRQPLFDRQARLFGDLGQQMLRSLKVGIVGLGGGGSLINEWLARLGVGHIVAIDPDRIELSNLPRVVGATLRDVHPWGMTWPVIGQILRRRPATKVSIARRVAHQASSSVRFNAIEGNLLDERTARHLADADFIFLATDTIQSRLVFNALVHQYLIPGIQVGVKVATSKGAVEEIHAAARPVIPGHACLDCYGLIPPGRLREEGLSSDERKGQRYVQDDDEDIIAPSVITLNVLSAAQAVNDFLMMFTGLFQPSVELTHQVSFVRERALMDVSAVRPRESCPDCGGGSSSRRARGDRARLPCRVN